MPVDLITPDTMDRSDFADGAGGASADLTPQRVGAEDLEARFDALLASHSERAVRIAWRLVGGDRAAAEDVAQDAFLNAYRALPRFRGEARLETWFYRILVRRAQSHRRWQAVRRLWHAESPGEAPDPRPRANGDPGLRDRIRLALEALTRRQREAFVLVYMEGLSATEAAAVLNLPSGTLKSHLQRARTKLRRELADLREAPAGGSRK